jgi:hypothetical protein
VAVVGDIGINIDYQFIDEDGDPVDVSLATTITIYLQAPDGTQKNFGASFVGDGSDGWIRYTTVATSDLDQAGRWQIQGYADDGPTNYGFRGTLYVGDVGEAV